MLKVCTKCRIEKDFSSFAKNKRTKDGLAVWCKTCHKGYLQTHAKEVSKRQRLYNLKNKDLIKEQQKRYQVAHKEEIKLYQKEYMKTYVHKTKRIRDLAYNKKYYHDNVQYFTAWTAAKRKRDPLFYLTHQIACLIRMGLRKQGYTKKSRTHQILGCSFEELKLHLEKQFVEGMSWENRHLWHIDHIIPVSSAKTEEELLKLNHYMNLQPLWAEDNLKKGCKHEHD